MGESKPSFKTNMIYGLFATLPFALIVIVFIKLVEVLEKIAKATGLHSTFGAGLAIVLALVLFLVVCYLAGIMVQTRIGSLSFGKMEEKLLVKVPGYRIISSIFKGAAENKVEAYRPATIQLGQPGISAIGFVMEENNNDTVTVFFPSVPAPTVGSLYIVERSLVTFLEARHLDVVNCITEWGVGSNKFIGRHPA